MNLQYFDDGFAVPVLAGSDLKKGVIIDDRYRIERQLGVGGGGAVYQCFDQRDEQQVAVKILLNRADLARFKREREAQEANVAASTLSVYLMLVVTRIISSLSLN